MINIAPVEQLTMLLVIKTIVLWDFSSNTAIAFVSFFVGFLILFLFFYHCYKRPSIMLHICLRVPGIISVLFFLRTILAFRIFSYLTERSVLTWIACK